MLKKKFTIAFVSLFVSLLIGLNLFSLQANAQQRKIPKQPFQITDASTGKSISEVLIIPRYSSGSGVSTMAGEGPGFSVNSRDYVDNPFVYQTGKPFSLKLPKSAFVNLLFIAAGKGRAVDGIVIISPKYRPLWTDDLWTTGDKRKIQLNPISDKEWSLILEKKLNPLIKDTFLTIEDYRFWGLYEKSRILHIYYNKNERELVRSFLQENKK